MKSFPFEAIFILIHLFVFAYSADQEVNVTRNCIIQNGINVAQNVASTSGKAWTRAAIAMQNKWRELHGSPPLILNIDLCRSAQWVANNLMNKSLVTMKQMKTRENYDLPGVTMSCSENIWISPFVNWRNNSLIPARYVMSQWYAEVVHYNYAKANAGQLNVSQVRNFTNMIWKNSKECCVVYAQNNIGTHTYVVAHYFPPGNPSPEQYRNNIRPTRFGLGSDYDHGSMNNAFKFWIFLSILIFIF